MWVLYNKDTGEFFCNNARLVDYPERTDLEEKELADSYAVQVVWDTTRKDYISVEDIQSRTLKPYDFLKRFTLSESILIENSIDPVVKHLLHMFNIADEIYLDEQQLKDGLSYFVSINLLSEQRKQEILGV